MKYFIFIFVISWSVATLSKETFPATFSAGRFNLSTLKQFDERIKELYPTLVYSRKKIANIKYKDSDYKAMTVEVHGILNSDKIEQTLTYINLHPGLWKLLYVVASECQRGEVSRDGKSIEAWICKEIYTPISKAFIDLFIAESKDIDIEQLSIDWGKEVVKYVAPDLTPKKPKLITLADIRKTIVDNRGNWVVIKSSWSGRTHSPVPPQPAILIRVNVPFTRDIVYRQQFLYVIKGKMLHLKEIDGKMCEYLKVYKRSFCRPLQSQTSITPFPMVMINSEEFSSDLVVNKNQPNMPKKIKFSCGNIMSNYSTALRLYFEKSMMFSQDIEGFRKAFSITPLVADPEKLFLPKKTFKQLAAVNKSPFPLSNIVEELSSEIQKGKKGRCDSFIPFAESFETIIKDRAEDIDNLITLLKENDFDEEVINQEITEKNEYTQELWKTLKKSRLPRFMAIDPKLALDVASGNLLRKYRAALSRVADKEELLTAALVKQDNYSRLLFSSEVSSSSQILHGSSKRLYFGISVSTGSAAHYIHGLHPETKLNSNLKIGDKIIIINGVVANPTTMSAKDVDDILINTKKSIALLIERNGVKHEITLVAKEIDVMRSYYSLKLLRETNGATYLKVRIASFVSGLADSLYKVIQDKVRDNDIKGIILDLQSNGGGSASEAASIISFFIKERVPYYSRIGSRSLTTAEAYPLKKEMFISDLIPLVVQVDASTASASELVTSSLKDLNRAIIVGATTFGKLVGQYYESAPLSNKKNLAMLVTSTELFTPLGRSLNGIGIRPDVTVYSKQGGQFKDGNNPGVDYDVSVEKQSELYDMGLSEKELAEIQSGVVIDETDIDKVSLEVLSRIE